MCPQSWMRKLHSYNLLPKPLNNEITTSVQNGLKMSTFGFEMLKLLFIILNLKCYLCEFIFMEEIN